MTERIKLAGGVIRNDNHKILLLHREAGGLSWWEMPGGQPKANEMPETAVRRGLWEQLGVTVTQARFLGSVTLSREHCYECEWYAVSTPDVPQIREPETFDAIDYFSLPQLNKIAHDLSPNMLAFRKRLNDGEIRLEP